jgi:hypothetical protein
MKGFITLLLTLLYLSAVLTMTALLQAVQGAETETQTEWLVLENHHARELELRRAILNTIMHSARSAAPVYSTSDDVSAAIGADLSALEDLEDSYFSDYYPITVNFWCGIMTDDELRSLPSLTLSSRLTQKCADCVDLDAVAVRAQGESGVPVTTCASMLSVNIADRTVTVSNPDPRVTPPFSTLGTPVFGITLLNSRDNLSSVVVIPQNTKVRW